MLAKLDDPSIGGDGALPNADRAGSHVRSPWQIRVNDANTASVRTTSLDLWGCH
jgi:hypothetical protein